MVSHPILSQKGMEDVFGKAANLAMQHAGRDHQASQRKAIEMVNKEKKHMEGVHFGRIAYVHPDYQEIFNYQKFYEFINNLPEEDRKICNAIVDRGSSRRVKALLSVYKQSIRREAEEKGENGKALQGKQLTYKPRTVSERKDDKMHVMVMVHIHIPTAINMRVSGKMTRCMVMVYIHIPTAINMRVSGKMTRCMVRVSIHGLITKNT